MESSPWGYRTSKRFPPVVISYGPLWISAWITLSAPRKSWRSRVRKFRRRLPRINNQTAGLLALFLVGLVTPACASWKVMVRGTDVTGLAAPIEHAGAPDVNVSALSA